MFKTFNKKCADKLSIVFDKLFDKAESVNESFVSRVNTFSKRKKIFLAFIFVTSLFCFSFILSNSFQYTENNHIEKVYYDNPVINFPSFPSVQDIVSGIVLGISNPKALIRMLVIQIVTNMCLQYGANAFNACCKYAVNLLTMHPDAWADGKGYAISKNLSAAFQVIATVLLVVFFLIGLCDEALDNNKEIRLESVIRLIIRFALAEFLIVNCFTIISGFFTIVDDMLPYINGSESIVSGDMTDLYGDLLKKLSSQNAFTTSPDASLTYSPSDAMTFGKGTLYLVISVVYFFVAFISGCILVFEAFFRFFKILILLPYGTIANSTLAGTNAMRQTAIQFWKYALSVILDAITMLITLRIFAVVFPTIDIFDGFIDGDVGKVLTQICFFFVLIGVIKGSSNITKQALGI